MGRVSAEIEETPRRGFTRWKPISADWYLRQRYHREITLYHVAPKVVRSCLHMQQSRTLARYEFASAILAMRFVVKLYGFSEGEAE